MEKGNENSMNIFITGSESTGKSTLSKQIAEYFDIPLVTEFARDYITGLERDYIPSDLEIIGKQQIKQIMENEQEGLVVFDTGLIITSVWYQVKYGVIPEWLKKAIPKYGDGKYLICDTDIPWINDPVRENPHRREELNFLYQSKIREYGFDYEVVRGSGDVRLKNAIVIIEKWLSELTGK